MPWKECKPMDERLRFTARLLEGEKMAPVCREFGISRESKTATTTVMHLPLVPQNVTCRARDEPCQSATNCKS
jgi:hypothetical protein